MHGRSRLRYGWGEGPGLKGLHSVQEVLQRELINFKNWEPKGKMQKSAHPQHLLYHPQFHRPDFLIVERAVWRSGVQLPSAQGWLLRHLSP